LFGAAAVLGHNVTGRGVYHLHRVPANRGPLLVVDEHAGCLPWGRHGDPPRRLDGFRHAEELQRVGSGYAITDLVGAK
jgi:hypothetical protein